LNVFFSVIVIEKPRKWRPWPGMWSKSCRKQIILRNPNTLEWIVKKNVHCRDKQNLQYDLKAGRDLTLFSCYGLSLTKAIPLQACTGPESSRKLRFPDFKTFGT
jgi:hypothetical protein